jgi:protease IV
MNPTMNKTIIIIVSLLLVSWLFGQVVKEHVASSGETVAIISIRGTITGEGASGLGSTGTSSRETVKLIQEAEKDDEVRAIVLEINSGGGTPVASDEIAQAVKKANKPVVAWIREVGASGAYWIASASDHIVANRMSMTSSIGVIGSYLEISGLLHDYNVTYQRLVAGEYKDAGTPFKPLSTREEEIINQKILRLHELFIGEVATNRGLDHEQVRLLADGMYLLGEEAYQQGLVDELGGLPEVTAYFEREYNITPRYVEVKPKRGFSDLLLGIAVETGFATGKGIGATLSEQGTLAIRT